MSNFTKSEEFKTEFQKDIVEMRLTRLKRGDIKELSPYIKQPDENGNITLSFSENIEFTGMAAEILPRYVTNFKGLTDKAGEPIELEDILEETYFITLVGNIFRRLMEISFVSGDEEKKSEEQPVLPSNADVVKMSSA